MMGFLVYSVDRESMEITHIISDEECAAPKDAWDYLESMEPFTKIEDMQDAVRTLTQMIDPRYECIIVNPTEV